MTQPPPGPGGYPPDPGFPDPNTPPGYGAPGYPQPVYPPGQEPIPPRRPRRRSPIIAPVLAFIGLLLVAGASVWAMQFLSATLDEAGVNDPSPTAVVAGADDPDESDPTEELADPAPSDDPAATAEPAATDSLEDYVEEELVGPTAPPILVEPPSDERADVLGTILFTRSGDIWAASGTELDRLTNSDSIRSDSDPTWSPNGKHIYFIRTTKKTTSKSRPGGKYTLYPTDLMRMDADGTNKKKPYASLLTSGGLWFTHILQPSVSPNNTSVAVVSDGPNGSNDEVTLHIINSKTGRMRRVATATEDGLGHNDPAYSPDGTKIAFTYNDNAGTESDPKIAIHTCQSKSNCVEGSVKYLKKGFANPSWSPDGKFLAVETTDGTGRDIAVITSKRGDVRVELTNDGNSFAPVFSPAGDQIAYLHRDNLDIDLRVMTLDVDDRGNITLLDDRPVTSDGGLDGQSTPSWFIPKKLMPQEVEEVEAADDAAATEAATEAPADETASAEPDGVPPPPGS